MYGFLIKFAAFRTYVDEIVLEFHEISRTSVSSSNSQAKLVSWPGFVSSEVSVTSHYFGIVSPFYSVWNPYFEPSHSTIVVCLTRGGAPEQVGSLKFWKVPFRLYRSRIFRQIVAAFVFRYLLSTYIYNIHMFLLQIQSLDFFQ